MTARHHIVYGNFGRHGRASRATEAAGLDGADGLSLTGGAGERTQFHHARLAEHITVCNDYGRLAPLAPIDRVVHARASIMSDLDIFGRLGTPALCLWLLALFLPRMAKRAAPAH
jgi:hypothetical protein